MVEFQLFDRPVSVRSSSPCPLPDELIGFFPPDRRRWTPTSLDGFGVNWWNREERDSSRVPYLLGCKMRSDN